MSAAQIALQVGWSRCPAFRLVSALLARLLEGTVLAVPPMSLPSVASFAGGGRS